LDAAEAMMLAGKVKRGCHITPYTCDACGEWHVGNKVIVPVSRILARVPVRFWAVADADTKAIAAAIAVDASRFKGVSG
jgi:hypothetical protein